MEWGEGGGGELPGATGPNNVPAERRGCGPSLRASEQEMRLERGGADGA